MSSTKDSPTDQPEERLRRFIQAMEDWETGTWRVMKLAERTSDPDSFRAPALQSVKVIFEEFCTPKERIYLGRQDLPLSNPSDYCSKELVLTPRKQSARRVELVATSARKGFLGRWVYALVQQKGRWLVDNKKSLNDDGSESSWWL